QSSAAECHRHRLRPAGREDALQQSTRCFRKFSHLIYRRQPFRRTRGAARSEWRRPWDLLNGPQDFEESREAFDSNVLFESVLGGAGVLPSGGFEEVSSCGEADK